jgi:hypothetical protein
MRRALDPSDNLRSVPGVGSVDTAQILGRLGDPSRFRWLASACSFSGLIPSFNGSHGGATKSGDALLREALFTPAGAARKIDPTLAQRYHRLMTEAGKHHSSGVCTIATTLLTRIVSCWRSGQPYVIRDLDGTVLTAEEVPRIVSARYTIDPHLRAQRRKTKPSEWTSRRNKESQSVPSTGPSDRKTTEVATDVV